MGSACHQFGVYKLLPAVKKLLADNGLEESVEIKGAFCLGPCSQGIVLKVGDQLILNVNPANLDQTFASEIVPLLKVIDGS